MIKIFTRKQLALKEEKSSLGMDVPTPVYETWEELSDRINNWEQKENIINPKYKVKWSENSIVVRYSKSKHSR